MKERLHRKQLKELAALDGDRMLHGDELNTEVIKFYKSLMGTALPSVTTVNTIVMRKGPHLTHKQQLNLCRPITDQEIYNALNSIGDDKARSGWI